MQFLGGFFWSPAPAVAGREKRPEGAADEIAAQDEVIHGEREGGVMVGKDFVAPLLGGKRRFRRR